MKPTRVTERAYARAAPLPIGCEFPYSAVHCEPEGRRGGGGCLRSHDSGVAHPRGALAHSRGDLGRGRRAGGHRRGGRGGGGCHGGGGPGVAAEELRMGQEGGGRLGRERSGRWLSPLMVALSPSRQLKGRSRPSFSRSRAPLPRAASARLSTGQNPAATPPPGPLDSSRPRGSSR